MDDRFAESQGPELSPEASFLQGAGPDWPRPVAEGPWKTSIFRTIRTAHEGLRSPGWGCSQVPTALVAGYQARQGDRQGAALRERPRLLHFTLPPSHHSWPQFHISMTLGPGDYD
jgi:hypothetical protein